VLRRKGKGPLDRLLHGRRRELDGSAKPTDNAATTQRMRRRIQMYFSAAKTRSRTFSQKHPPQRTISSFTTCIGFVTKNAPASSSRRLSSVLNPGRLGFKWLPPSLLASHLGAAAKSESKAGRTSPELQRWVARRKPSISQTSAPPPQVTSPPLTPNRITSPLPYPPNRSLLSCGSHAALSAENRAGLVNALKVSGFWFGAGMKLPSGSDTFTHFCNGLS
jgi:hypothetical protein